MLNKSKFIIFTLSILFSGCAFLSADGGKDKDWSDSTTKTAIIKCPYSLRVLSFNGDKNKTADSCAGLIIPDYSITVNSGEHMAILQRISMDSQSITFHNPTHFKFIVEENGIYEFYYKAEKRNKFLLHNFIPAIRKIEK